MKNIKVKDCIPNSIKKKDLNKILLKFYNTNIIDFLNSYKNNNKKIFIIKNFIDKLNKGIKIDITHLFI